MANLDNKKLLACCANGAGSSLMMEKAIDKVMKKFNVKPAELRHCPVSEGKSAARNYDVLFCARTFEKNFENAKKAGTVVIPLRNVMSAPRKRAGFEGRRSAVRERTEIEKEGNTVMIQFSYTIRDELGIHARPAGQLAKVAKSFEPTVISITKEGKTVKASQLMKLMGLAIKKGHEITITVEGEREEEAAAAMKKFLEENL